MGFWGYIYAIESPVSNYTKSEMKRRGLANGSGLQRNEAEAILDLKQAVVEQEKVIELMSQKYKTLELQMIAQTEMIQDPILQEDGECGMGTAERRPEDEAD